MSASFCHPVRHPGTVILGARTGTPAETAGLLAWAAMCLATWVAIGTSRAPFSLASDLTVASHWPSHVWVPARAAMPGQHGGHLALMTTKASLPGLRIVPSA